MKYIKTMIQDKLFLISTISIPQHTTPAHNTSFGKKKYKLQIINEIDQNIDRQQIPF